MSYFILTIRAAVFKQVWMGLWGQSFLKHILLDLITPLPDSIWGGSWRWGQGRTLSPSLLTPESSRTQNLLVLFRSSSTVPQEERQTGFWPHRLPLLFCTDEMHFGGWATTPRSMFPFSSFNWQLVTWRTTNQINALQPLWSFFLPKTCFTGENGAASDAFTFKQNTGFCVLCICWTFTESIMLACYCHNTCACSLLLPSLDFLS